MIDTIRRTTNLTIILFTFTDQQYIQYTDLERITTESFSFIRRHAKHTRPTNTLGVLIALVVIVSSLFVSTSIFLFFISLAAVIVATFRLLLAEQEAGCARDKVERTGRDQERSRPVDRAVRASAEGTVTKERKSVSYGAFE